MGFQNQKLQLSVLQGQIDLKIHDFEHVPNFFILYYYDGPPFATGQPRYRHLLAGTIKDVTRYQDICEEMKFGMKKLTNQLMPKEELQSKNIMKNADQLECNTVINGERLFIGSEY
ncbi:MAG: hypothetical protein EZS28_021025 [Streblomastix strix]|uniref:Uncharacterized protein n=1 Tax=Streblomastix strix TaxID=222440 RepID=A0A5J4VLH6_9EUKA|nr:MAG: hypothetical protein EZS28_021025 [Streblomastix strix]